MSNMEKDMEAIKQIFPTLDHDIIMAVYESHGFMLEPTVNACFEICNPTTAEISSEAQISSSIYENDLRFAKELQERESLQLVEMEEERHRQRLVASDSLEGISEKLKKGVDSVKTFFKRATDSIIAPSAAVDTNATPRTEYSHLPADHEFENFLNDSDDVPLSSSPAIDGNSLEITRVGSKFGNDEEFAKALDKSYK